MGLGELAGCAIRISLPWNTSPSDIDAFIAAYAGLPASPLAAPAAPTLVPA
jgi:cysteine desulfurase